ncbi:MAG: metalloregulator ArsR/SmtB family transcription factor [Cyanobacteriota bacterium]
MPQISPTALSHIADYFKVLSEVSRLQILCCLKSGPKSVTDIIEATGLGQANVSKHLKILTQAGIVTRQPQGVSVFYEIADSTIFELCQVVCEQLAVKLEETSQQLELLEVFKKI